MKDYNGLINLNYPVKPYCLYMIHNDDDRNDKNIYIGVTTDQIQRCYRHSKNRLYKRHQNSTLYMWMNDVIETRKQKVSFFVMLDSLSEEEAFVKEKEFISDYQRVGYTILNDTLGGKGPSGITPWNKGKKDHLSEDQILSLSLSHKGQVSPRKGVTITEETRQKIVLSNKRRKERNWINPRKKTVYKYSNDNVLLATYYSLEEAGQKESVSPTSVGEWCRKDKKPRNGFVYSYTELT